MSKQIMCEVEEIKKLFDDKYNIIESFANQLSNIQYINYYPFMINYYEIVLKITNVIIEFHNLNKENEKFTECFIKIKNMQQNQMNYLDILKTEYTLAKFGKIIIEKKQLTELVHYFRENKNLNNMITQYYELIETHILNLGNIHEQILEGSKQCTENYEQYMENHAQHMKNREQFTKKMKRCENKISCGLYLLHIQTTILNIIAKKICEEINETEIKNEENNDVKIEDIDKLFDEKYKIIELFGKQIADRQYIDYYPHMIQYYEIVSNILNVIIKYHNSNETQLEKNVKFTECFIQIKNMLPNQNNNLVMLKTEYILSKNDYIDETEQIDSLKKYFDVNKKLDDILMQYYELIESHILNKNLNTIEYAKKINYDALLALISASFMYDNKNKDIRKRRRIQ